ncbi:hypothetical protein ACGFJ7_26075 [Actinoplanes sp. NPDC048988]|uniref:hypothetical protein n=1 Tax=Actinoplanes sp. NPDC048988 TaxID=3363901 RepID=UPI003717F7DA
MRAHRSGQTYVEQHRELMRTVPPLEEIDMDLRAAVGLFGDDQHSIRANVNKITAYLADGGDEYEARHTRRTASRNCRPSWTRDFIAGGRDFRDGYQTPLTDAKAAMRER